MVQALSMRRVLTLETTRGRREWWLSVKELVDYLARALVDNPEPVQVIENSTPGETLFQLKVGKEDLGKVIGKKGRTAKALRTLLAAVGAKQNLRVNLEIIEPDREESPAPDAAAGAVSSEASDDAAVDEAPSKPKPESA